MILEKEKILFVKEGSKSTGEMIIPKSYNQKKSIFIEEGQIILGYPNIISHIKNETPIKDIPFTIEWLEILEKLKVGSTNMSGKDITTEEIQDLLFFSSFSIPCRFKSKETKKIDLSKENTILIESIECGNELNFPAESIFQVYEIDGTIGFNRNPLINGKSLYISNLYDLSRHNLEINDIALNNNPNSTTFYLILKEDKRDFNLFSMINLMIPQIVANNIFEIMIHPEDYMDYLRDIPLNILINRNFQTLFQTRQGYKGNIKMDYPIMELNFLTHLEGINNIYVIGHEDWGTGVPDEVLYSKMKEHKGFFCPMEFWTLLYTKKRHSFLPVWRTERDATKKLMKNQFKIYFERNSPLSSKIYKNQVFIIAENTAILDIIKDFIYEWKPKFEQLCHSFEEEIKRRTALSAEKMINLISKYDEIHEKLISTLPMIDKIYQYYGENKNIEDDDLEKEIEIDPFKIVKLIDEYHIVSKEKEVISNMVQENHRLERYINLPGHIRNIINYYYRHAIRGKLDQIKSFYISKLPRIVKKESFNTTLISEIEAKIKEGEQLKKEGKLINAENIFKEQLENAKSISNNSKKEQISKKIREYLKPLQIPKIKNILKELASKHTRLQVMDIIDKCGEDEELIITTIQEMITNREISAEYFETSKAVAFIPQIDVEDIDRLMKTFDDWEKEGKGKKKCFFFHF